MNHPISLVAVLDQTMAVSERLLLEQWRQRRGLIFWVLFPAAMMLLFGLVYSHNDTMRAGLDAAAAGILMGAALFFSCLGGTVSIIAAERERHTLGRLLASPLHPAAYFLGVVNAQMVLAAVQVIVLYSIAGLIGAKYHGSYWLGGAILVLSVFSYVGMGFFLGARFARRSEEVVVALSAIGVPLLVLGGTFFPLEIMPAIMQKVAQWSPILHMNQAFKGVAAYNLSFKELQFELIFLLAFCVFSLALGLHSYRHLLDEDHQA
jgi:ABC-2 type transport system permease protein